MAQTLTFTLGTPCASGGHIPVTATLAGNLNETWTLTIRREALTRDPGQDERQSMIEVLFSLLARQLAVNAPAEVKDEIEATTIHLTVGV